METDESDPIDLHYEFSQLSLADLLAARDTYHSHLMNKKNVVGTAVGYYLIRDTDPWPDKHGKVYRRGPQKAREFSNSEVRDYSWPCVLVLVSTWQEETEFGVGRPNDPAEMVPKALLLPDGKAVPVCVVWVHETQAEEQAARFAPDVPPASKFGGGLPISVISQELEQTATAGCLVSDGHYTYVLTAAHVCGEPGTPVVSQLRSGEFTVGKSSGKHLSRVPFVKAYPEFPGKRSYSAIDAGLIKLDDLTRWTSNIYGLPPLGPLADFHEHNLSLRLIDRQVVGYGAASGLLVGKIKALFYRYRSVGGFDYIADYLISPSGKVATRHGDSGMIWNLDLTSESGDKPVPLKSRVLQPLAMEWGGQVFSDHGKPLQFAVASSLSTICRLLDLQLVNDRSPGVSGYWGRVGHYSIATFAARLVTNPDLEEFLNHDRILKMLSFDLDVIRDGRALEELVADLAPGDAFVPLADVPDEIWKKLPPPSRKGRRGGRDLPTANLGINGPEHPNHYADIDAPVGPDGRTWRDMCLEDADNISVPAWQHFYQRMAEHAENAHQDELAQQYREPLKQGLLPFRVWQVFDAMAGFVADGDLTGFLAAAGICAHYVGDASQVLHGSVLADGDPARHTDRLNRHRMPAKFGEGVHSAYESQMVSRKSDELITLIMDKLPDSHGLQLCQTGKGAAAATIRLMEDAAKILPPLTLLESFEKNLSDGKVHVSTLDAMWDDLGEATAEVLLFAARALAMIWDSAWQAGGGNAKILGHAAPTEDEVRARYADPDFLPSRTLDKVGPFLNGS